MKVLVKLLSAYKSVSYVDIYSLLHCIFNSLWLIYSYNFFKFIQSHKTYSRIHARWICTTLISSEYHFVGVYRSNPFLSNLMSVYVISSYVDIASFSNLFEKKKKKKIVAIYFSKLFRIYIPILLINLLPEALKF